MANGAAMIPRTKSIESLSGHDSVFGYVRANGHACRQWGGVGENLRISAQVINMEIRPDRDISGAYYSQRRTCWQYLT